MKTITYKKYSELQLAALNLSQEIIETPISFYFRVFDEKGNSSALHIFYKNNL